MTWYQQQPFAQYGGYGQTFSLDPQLVNSYGQIVQNTIQFLVNKQELHPNLVNHVLRETQNAANTLITNFQMAKANTGNYSLEEYNNYIFHQVVNICNNIRSRLANNTQMNLGYSSPSFSTQPSMLGTQPNPMMGYYQTHANSGNPLNTDPTPDSFKQMFRTNAPLVSNANLAYDSAPKPQPESVKEEAVLEHATPSFPSPQITNIRKLEQTEDQKLSMEEMTIPGIHTCKELFSFGDPDSADAQKYNFAYFDMHIPYSNEINVAEDMYTAFPQLLTAGHEKGTEFVHIFEFDQMIPIIAPYERVTTRLQEIKDILTVDPYIAYSELVKLDHATRELIINHMIRDFNRLSSCYLSMIPKNKQEPFCVEIDGLQDILAFKNEKTDPTIMAYKDYPDFEGNLNAVTKALCNIFFHTRNNNKKPYLDVESEEGLIYASAHEASGIRVGKCTGRDWDRFSDDDSTYDTVRSKIKLKTILLKKRYYIRTSMVLPEWEFMEKHDGRWSIPNATHPLHVVLKHILSKQINLYQMDTPHHYPRTGSIYVGVSRNNLILTAD